MTLLLPVAAQAQKLELGPIIRDSEYMPSFTKELKVLVVDDEQSVARFLCELLESSGLDVTMATSSADALTMFEQDPQRFSLVITDQTMPQLSGLELSQKLLQIRPDLPIVLCTGYSDVVDEEVAERAGVSRFMRKPLDAHGLLEELSALLETA